MYKKVLIPLNGSKEEEQVCGFVLDALEPNGEIILLYVISRRASGHLIPTFLARRLKENVPSAMAYLERVAREYRDSPRNWRFQVVISDDAVKGIAEVAARQDPDVIVVFDTGYPRGAGDHNRSLGQQIADMTDVAVKVISPATATCGPPAEPKQCQKRPQR